MEDIGNLVYYILIFVVVIISWINNSNKKKQQQQTTIPSPFPTQNMPVLPPPPPRKKKQGPPPIPKRVRQESHSDSFLSSNYREKTPVLLEENDTSIADELDLRNPESFRRAVIYSEILNRKEW